MIQKITFNKSRDTIAIIAPSSGCADAKEKLLAGVKLLESQGFKCKYDKDILSGHESVPYFSSSRGQRTHELKSVILDPKVRIIWAFRGGYGASEIALDCYDLKPQNHKILIGFSDITILHLLFNQKFKMPVIHGSVITSLVGEQANMLGSIISVLKGLEMKFKLKAVNSCFPYSGGPDITARITGGNLAVICHMIGSKLSIDTENKIIFLEDINEKGYHIHRYLMQMKQSGLFDKAKALILGDFSKSDDNLETSLQHFCEEHLPIPTFRTTGIGHRATNYPVVIGAQAQIKNNILAIESPFELI